MRELFQKRKQVFRNQCLKYSRYVFNDHFVLFLLVFTGFLAVQYSQLLRNLPANHSCFSSSFDFIVASGTNRNIYGKTR